MRFDRTLFFTYLLPILLILPFGFWSFRKYISFDLSPFVEFFSLLVIFSVYRYTRLSFLNAFVVIYLSLFIVFSRFFSVPFFEIIVAVKSFVYYILLSNLYPSRSLIDSGRAERIVRVLISVVIWSMFFKYFFSHVLGVNHRPFLFFENNFEVVLPLFVFFSGFFSNRLRAVAFFVVLLSFSKSGIGSLVLVYLFFLALRFRFLFFVYFIFWLFFAFLFVLNFESLMSIDRVQYVFYFFTSSLSSFDLIFSFHLKSLPEEVCSVFSYMRSKVLVTSDGLVCYSRILHLWWLRTFYDFGFIGLLLHLLLIIKSLKFFTRHTQFLLFFLGAFNGLSVSGFGNSFFILLIIISHFLKSSRHIRPMSSRP